MESKKTILEPSYIKILVEPIGEINAKIFEKYVHLFTNNFSLLPMYSLTRFSKENVKSPFVNQNWKTSHIRLKFITKITPSTKPDRELCAYEKIHGYIGIMSCKKDVKSTYEIYKSRKQRLTDVSVSRLFAVEYDPEKRPINNDFNDYKELIIILPTEDLGKLKFYVERSISDLINSLIRYFERKVVHPDKMKKNSSTIISSTKDLEKVKLFSEYALLAGDIYDAKDGYTRVLKSSTSKKNPLIIINSKECLICCLCIKNMKKKKSAKKAVPEREMNLNEFEEYGGLEIDVNENLFLKIIKLYDEVLYELEKKKLFFPYLFDSIVRVIDFIIKFHSVIDHDVYSNIYIEKFSTLDVIISKVGLLKKITIMKYKAMLYKRIKNYRKVGFTYWTISKIYYKLSNYSNAIEMIVNSFKSFMIPIRIHGDEWVVQEVSCDRGWKEIQVKILKDVVLFSKRNYLFKGRILFYILANYYTILTKKEQENLFQELDKIFLYTPNIPKHVSFSLTRFPILFSIHPIDIPDSPYVVNEKKTKDEVFLFRPDNLSGGIGGRRRRKKVKHIKNVIFVQNEICTFELTLINPFKDDIILRSLQIKVNLKCIIYSTGSYLPSKQYLKLKLHMIPKEEGELNIKYISFFLNKISNQIVIDFDLLKESNTTINVINAIPLLECNFRIPSLNVYEGEIINNCIILQNISNANVEFLQIKCTNDYSNIIKWDNESMNKKLPIKGKERLEIPLLITVKKVNLLRDATKKEFVFEVIYGKGTWRRKKKIFLYVKWEKSLTYKMFNESNMRIMEVENRSDENFVVYMKDLSHLNVPPNYSKQIIHNCNNNVQFYETQNMQNVPFQYLQNDKDVKNDHVKDDDDEEEEEEEGECEKVSIRKKIE